MNIFNADIISEFFQDHYLLFLSCIFFGTFICTWYIMPKIIWVSNEKQLVKPVIGRSAHVQPTPTFGGVAFFMTMILTLSLVQALRLSHVGNHLIAAITILFMVGLKDDLVVSTARVKLVGQFLAIAFLVFSPELQITSLQGFLSLTDIPPGVGFGIAAFLLLAIINSYNLIDGIDGLAAVAGIIIGVAYTLVFYLTGDDFYVLVSMMLVGILCAYLRFNFSRGKRKIFMGDSGALIIGLLIGFLTLRVLSIDAATFGGMGLFLPENRLLFVLAVLFLPFFDTTRSILIRLMDGRSPFDADRNHTHHVMIDAGFTHKQASFLLGLFSCAIIGIFLVLGRYFNSFGMTAVLLALFGLSCWGFDAIKKAYPGKDRPAGVKVRKPENSRVSEEPVESL